MTKKIMLEAIYKEIANKENKTRICPYCDEVLWIKNRVLIWDVLDYEEKNDFIWDIEDCDLINLKTAHWHSIRNLWEFKRLPIEEQSEETIKYIYNLLTK